MKNSGGINCVRGHADTRPRVNRMRQKDHGESAMRKGGGAFEVDKELGRDGYCDESEGRWQLYSAIPCSITCPP